MAPPLHSHLTWLSADNRFTQGVVTTTFAHV